MCGTYCRPGCSNRKPYIRSHGRLWCESGPEPYTHSPQTKTRTQKRTLSFSRGNDGIYKYIIIIGYFAAFNVRKSYSGKNLLYLGHILRKQAWRTAGLFRTIHLATAGELQMSPGIPASPEHPIRSRRVGDHHLFNQYRYDKKILFQIRSSPEHVYRCLLQRRRPRKRRGGEI